MAHSFIALPPRAIDITGENFGRLVVLGPVDQVFYPKRGKSIRWLCECRCGGETTTHGHSLRAGLVTSCGCYRREVSVACGKANTRHGKTGTTEWIIWSGMSQRCTNTNSKRWKHYGARGIRVCERWCGRDGFENFLADMGPRPSVKHSIDRIDVNGDYSPENCRWATNEDQQRNKRHTKFISAFGKTGPLASFIPGGSKAVEYDIARFLIKKGWKPEDAIAIALREPT
jgi:hypothetical protein